MSNILQPPSTNIPIVQEVRRGFSDLTPVWRKWFLDLTAIVNKSGGVTGFVPASRVVNTVFPLQGGGDLSEDRAITITPAGNDGDVQFRSGTTLGGITGITIVITTARLTGGGANGSMTFTRGVLTAQTAAT